MRREKSICVSLSRIIGQSESVTRHNLPLKKNQNQNTMKRLVFFLFCSMMALASFAQNRVTGVVTDATGEPLIGASVVVKGTTLGAITDIDGNFSIVGVDNGSIIQVSFIGYESVEVKWAGKPISVALAEANQTFEEVVVTGYGGHQKRGTLTTAITKMDDRVIEKAAFANVGQALQGAVTGLRVVNTSGSPGASPNIQLRGIASLNGTANPLILVDGVVRNSLGDVNSNDIASIQVLKDAAATAIYGARANGGVILIETKQGKKGHTEVTYSVKTGWNFADKGDSYLNTGDYIYYNRMGAKRYNNAISGYGGSFNPDGQQGYGTNNTLYDIAYADTERGGKIVANGGHKMTDPFSGKEIAYNEYGGILDKYVFNDGAFSQDHHINMGGGNENGSFNIGLGFYSEDGTIQLTNYKRFTGKINGSYQVLPFLQVKGGVDYVWSQSPNLYINEYSLFYRTRSARPTWNPVDDNGNPKAGFGNSDGNYRYWANVYDISNSTRRQTYNLGLVADIIKDKLTLTANGSLHNYDYQYESFTKAYKQDNQSSPNTNRSSSAQVSKYTQMQFNGLLQYVETFANVHNVDAMVGAEYYSYDNWAMSASTKGSATDDIPTMNAGAEPTGANSTKSTNKYRIMSFLGRIQYNYDLKYLASFTFRNDGVSKLSDNRWGFFPGVSLGWNAMREQWLADSKFSEIVSTLKPRVSYGVNGNVTPIGSYTVYGAYSATTNYNGNPTFYQSSMSNGNLRWERSKTLEAGLDLGLLNNRVNFIFDYYKRNTDDLLTTLNIPGYTGFTSVYTNLGEVQNQGFEMEVRANLFRNDNWSWDVTANMTTIANKIIKLPENSNENNRQGGFEVAAGPAKANSDGTYTYNTKWVSGWQEGGTVGEIVAYKQDHIFKDWEDVKAHAATRVDEIANLYGPDLADQINPRTGKTYKKSNGWKPIEPGDVCWEDMDGDNKITSYDKKIIGNYMPKVTGGFSTTVAYKNLSLYARFDYALGHTLYNGYKARVLGQYQGTFNLFECVKDMWSEENTNADLPAFYYADQLAKRNITRENNAGYNLSGNSSRFYEKGDYLCLREVTLNYDLKKMKWMDKAHLSKLSLYVTGQNLLYFTKYSGINPEPAVSGGINAGVDDGRWGVPRKILVGLNIGF